METAIIIVLAILLVGAVAAIFIVRKITSDQAFQKGIEHRRQEAEAVLGSAEQEARAKVAEAERRIEEAQRMLEDAGKKAETKKKEALVEAKDEIHKLRSDAEKEIRDRRNEVSKQERRIHQKEETLDKKLDSLEQKEEVLQEKLKAADALKEEAESLKKVQMDTLERISELTREQAKEYILQTLEEDLVHDKAVKVAAFEQQIKEDCEEKARSYISLAIAKCAADQVSEAAVSVVALPNDEMKGRIIGREGRNIRTLETLTGVDLIIDDTPEAITVSCFDPVRREVARLALEKLISDGR
ncbi:MAG: DUF3552 domain-containing protein, partial [Oscillospiraceae bacterium]|nr:DUF3552 domain-containing protein [Oscillospiraceae bacterium]